MRVLHLGRDLAPRSNGGLSVALAGMLRALAAEPARLRCATWSFDAWRPRASSASADLPTPAWADEACGRVLRIQAPAQLDAARALCHAWSPELLHVHHAMLWEEAGRLAEGRLPRIYHLHTLQAEQERLRGQAEPTLSSEAETRALSEADVVIAPSRAAADALLRHAPAVEARLRVIGLGVEAPVESGSGKEREAVVLVAGRFSDVKGTDLLMEILPDLLARFPQARVRLAGGCPENPRAQRRWLRHLERAFGKSWARVDFLGWLGPQALSAEYLRARLLLCPSRFETFGQSVAEAMAHALPVVAARAGGLEELVEDGLDGRLCDVGDHAALTAASLDLLRRPEEAARLGRNAARRARSWGWAEVVGELLTLYAELSSRPRP